VTLDTDNARLVRSLNADLLRTPRAFTFAHISLPDAAGHKHGFMSKKYLSAVKETDRLLGTVLKTVSSKPALKAHTLVVLTADHGGNGANHSNPAQLQNHRVPFMTWGAGVAKSRSLYAINSSVKDPKNSRPSYSGKQPIRNADVANLATDVLDLPTVPGSELNRPRTLNVFPPARTRSSSGPTWWC
jgi:phosphoglycerol transferase MdoB-like AlkP superfamily enzyme